MHVWQEDKGFRASRIRNMSFAHAKYDYIIVVDGDVVMERHFLEDHLRLAKPGYFICGSRIRMREQLTHRMY